MVEVLDAANTEDPWLAFTLPDRGARRSLFSLFLRTVAFPHGTVLVTGDPVEGVAVLLPPGAGEVADPDVGAVVLQLHGRRAGTALDADAIVQRHRPAGPLWLLHTLAVHPDAQGRGVGTALLRAAVARTGGAPLAVEAASPRARDLYLAEDFALDAVVELSRGHGLPAGAPTIWLLTHGADPPTPPTPPTSRSSDRGQVGRVDRAFITDLGVHNSRSSARSGERR